VKKKEQEYRGLLKETNEFKKCCQRKTTLVKDECDLLLFFLIVLSKWMNPSS
jgi:hypothetical protein